MEKFGVKQKFIERVKFESVDIQGDMLCRHSVHEYRVQGKKLDWNINLRVIST